MTALMSECRRPAVQRKPRVLIVEDEPNNRWALCALLRRLGYDCTTASDGREALAVVRDFAPAVIVMDLMMPVLDGREATKRLKADARTRCIPVLALTADATPDGTESARAAGVDDVLHKPVDLPKLLDRLEHYIGR
jgi:CheY-like chemotaxis protein